MTKTQIQAVADYDVQHADSFSCVGCLVGLVLGLVLASLAFFVQPLEQRSLSLRSLGYIPLLACLSGLIGGHVLSTLILWARKRRFRRKWRQSHNRD
jgi:hypothetical protein